MCRVMLTIRIHLDNYSVVVLLCIKISSLQGNTVSRVVGKRNNKSPMFFSYLCGLIHGTIVDHKHWNFWGVSLNILKNLANAGFFIKGWYDNKDLLMTFMERLLV